MSKGNPILKFRVTTDELFAIEMAVFSANIRRRDEPYTISAWIRAAIREKLQHLARSNKRKSKRPLDNSQNTV